MGGALKPTRGDEAHIRFLTDALMDWHALGGDTDWDGSAARNLWNEHIKPLPGGFDVLEPSPRDPVAEQPTRKQRREREEELREKLKRIAEYFANTDGARTRRIYEAWEKVWSDDDGIERTKHDFEHTLIRNGSGKVIGSRTSPKRGKETSGGWHGHLRLLTDWIMGWRLPGVEDKHWTRHVGGLSLTRIATMRALYQLHKAFAMRPRPDNVQGAPERGESNAGVAQSILDAMERMREQRVKQIASRIVEAALGVGIERDRVWDKAKRKWRYPKRPRELLYHVDDQGVAHGDRRFKTCHAVVIENLRNYRPDELQTRRENRSLMNWSSGKVRKYLEEACQLHGLHLREVMPNYTSRQCSRTGLPGIRCADVSVSDFLDKPWWRKAVKRAKERELHPTREKPYDAEAQLLVAIDLLWPDRNSVPEADRTMYGDKVQSAKPLRLISKGGDLLVAASPPSCQAHGQTACPFCDGKRALQADLNAAANIGLRALLDPDFLGKWWYVPCDSETGKPANDKCAGAACLDLGEPLIAKVASEHGNSGRGKKRSGQKTNAWRDVGGVGEWETHGAYWAAVKERVVSMLRDANGTPATFGDVAPGELPW
jgi:IS605 OrfB family transposase